MNNRELFYSRIKKYFKDDYELFISKMKEPQTHGFFINTKKDTKENILKMIDFDYSEYNEHSFRHNNLNIGKTKAHELGLIYSQGLEASLPSLLPLVKEKMLVLDMCAAPGGKSINILNLLSDDSLLIANEHDFTRLKALNSNLERLGYENVIITNKETNELSKQLEESIDLVILDAPCSGEGMVRKYPEIIEEYSLKNIENLANLQASLLEDAYKCLKPNGQLLYSTCTYALEEDEIQINNFLNKHKDMHLIKGPKKLSFIDNTEGQFMVLLEKDNIGNSFNLKLKKTDKIKLVEEFIKENIEIDNYYLYKQNDFYYLSLIPMPELNNKVIRYGICVGEIIRDRFEPNHSLFRSNKLVFKNTYNLNDQEYEKFISGNEIAVDLNDGFIQVKYNNYPLGFGKVSKKRLKNKYPKGLRRMI